MAQGAENAETRDLLLSGVKKAASLIDQLIRNNPTLLLPVADHQAIDISIAVLLLITQTDNRKQVSAWLSELTERATFAIRVHGRYPCILSSYSDLLEHPIKNNDDYFKKVTSGSILYPLIALWASILEDDNLYAMIKTLKTEHLPHCSFQIWFPDKTSENSIYMDRAINHGATLSHVPVERSMSELQKQIFDECDRAPYFENLSAVKYGYWPIVLVACRHHRLPVPPQIWKQKQKKEQG